MVKIKHPVDRAERLRINAEKKKKRQIKSKEVVYEQRNNNTETDNR